MEFIVEGEPQGKARPRFSRRSGTVYTPAKTANYDGLTGLIKGFTPEGEVVKPVQVQTVKNGLFRYYGVITDPKLITPSK